MKYEAMIDPKKFQYSNLTYEQAEAYYRTIIEYGFKFSCTSDGTSPSLDRIISEDCLGCWKEKGICPVLLVTLEITINLEAPK
jgi:hypothetical protein